MAIKEGNLEAPKRAPIDWKNPDYYEHDSLFNEMERVFDACHGCRRCVSLCDSFPTLFDLVDESETLEVDGVSKDDYMKVVDQCFLCDLCAETKCPYLPPHEWAIDFPHLMLRAKAYKHENAPAKWRDRLLTSTDATFGMLSHPAIAPIVNVALASKPLRKVIDKAVGIHQEAPLPKFGRASHKKDFVEKPQAPSKKSPAKVAIFATCYDKNTQSSLIEDLILVLEHNDIQTELIMDAKCCGMPKLELGDLPRVENLKDINFPKFLELIESGYDLISPIPSCVLMYKQEIPLMFPEDQNALAIKKKFFDPFEYLMLKTKEGSSNTNFVNSLGKVSYHAACHQRVQNFGAKTRDFLSLIPDTEISMIERCSGHDGTYAVKSETYDKAKKLVGRVQRQTQENAPDFFGSDCPMAGRLIENNLEGTAISKHPISMVRHAYGI